VEEDVGREKRMRVACSVASDILGDMPVAFGTTPLVYRPCWVHMALILHCDVVNCLK
jgi:hypothetical protein